MGAVLGDLNRDPSLEIYPHGKTRGGQQHPENESLRK